MIHVDATGILLEDVLEHRDVEHGFKCANGRADDSFIEDYRRKSYMLALYT